MICQKCGGNLIQKRNFVRKNGDVAVYQYYKECTQCHNVVPGEFISINEAKRQSKMATTALVLSLFGGTIITLAGVVLGLIDLVKNDKKSKHGASIVAIILGSLLIIGNALGTSVISDSESTDTNTVVENTASDYIEPTVTEAPTEVPMETEEEYKASCQEYKYKDVLRNPEDYVGQRVVVTVEISSVHSKDVLTPIKYYFANAETEPGSGYYWGDEYGIFDKRYDESLKLLDEDVIKVWGEISEPKETSSLIVNSEELFCIDMRYVELISE